MKTRVQAASCVSLTWRVVCGDRRRGKARSLGWREGAVAGGLVLGSWEPVIVEVDMLGLQYHDSKKFR
jgi:hypothetical protein